MMYNAKSQKWIADTKDIHEQVDNAVIKYGMDERRKNILYTMLNAVRDWDYKADFYSFCDRVLNAKLF